MRILISAGEASGEMYGAELIEALRRAAGAAKIRSTGQSKTAEAANISFEFFGVGGGRMRAAGCETVIDAENLSVVGITEILGHLPKIYRLFHKLIAKADKLHPDLAIVIDSPAFNWRVAREMKKRGIPVVYYVAPQFWAWRRGRVRLLRKYVDKALVIFPFEEKFYRERGVDAEFVGHPLAHLQPPSIERSAYAAQFSLDPNKIWITLMPGSRPKEVRMNLPTILEAASRLGLQHEFLLPVAPTLGPSYLEQLLERDAEARGAAENRNVDKPSIRLVPESLPALRHSRVGIVASGTATVEAALMGTPFVMVYRVSALTYFLGKPRVKVPHFAMVNLIAGEKVVPELVQNDFTAENVAAQVSQILPDGPARSRMIEGLASVRNKLDRPAGERAAKSHPPDRAAEIILALLKTHIAEGR